VEVLEKNIVIDPAIYHSNTSQTGYHTCSRTHKSSRLRGATSGRSDRHAVSDKHDERDGGDGVDEASSFKEDADGNSGGNSGDEIDGEALFDMDTNDNDNYAYPTNRHLRKIHSIITASSLSMANEISGNQSTEGGFTFLTQEAYFCSCVVKNTPFLSNDFTLNCKVLVFFGLVFFKEWHIIFCPEHNSFILMVELTKYL
jgi:hypothetical protein